MDLGHPPATGWQPLVCELLVEDIARSRAFWCGMLGFRTAYERPEERFVYLERPLADGRGCQIMLCQRSGKWETGQTEPPLGRGVMFQIAVDDLAPLHARLNGARWPIHTGPRDAWRVVGDREAGQREIFVQDPDGYLLMLNQDLGERAVNGG
jgi:catechol 2,3-dioxygenase-like lactoylglutathione lyase family enzyme